MANCPHEDFIADVEVNKLADCGHWMADLKIRCKACNTAFVFLGLGSGIDVRGASVSVDGTEARLALRPKGEPPAALEGIRGFSIRKL